MRQIKFKIGRSRRLSKDCGASLPEYALLLTLLLLAALATLKLMGVQVSSTIQGANSRMAQGGSGGSGGTATVEQSDTASVGGGVVIADTDPTN